MKLSYVCGEFAYTDKKMSNSGRALRDNKWGWLRAAVSLRNEETMSWPDKLLVPRAVIFSTNMMHAKFILMKISFNGKNKLQDVPVWLLKAKDFLTERADVKSKALQQEEGANLGNHDPSSHLVDVVKYNRGKHRKEAV